MKTIDDWMSHGYVVEMTDEDIMNGKPNTNASCPIALCLQREFQRPVNTYTLTTVVQFDDKTEMCLWHNPYIVDWIDNYDGYGEDDSESAGVVKLFITRNKEFGDEYDVSGRTIVNFWLTEKDGILKRA